MLLAFHLQPRIVVVGSLLDLNMSLGRALSKIGAPRSLIRLRYQPVLSCVSPSIPGISTNGTCFSTPSANAFPVDLQPLSR